MGLRGFRDGLQALTGKFGCSSSDSPPPSRVSQVQTPELAAQVAGSGSDSSAEQQLLLSQPPSPPAPKTQDLARLSSPVWVTPLAPVCNTWARG